MQKIKGMKEAWTYLFLVLSLIVLISPKVFASTFPLGAMKKYLNKPDHPINQYNICHTHLNIKLSTQSLELNQLATVNCMTELTQSRKSTVNND